MKENSKADPSADSNGDSSSTDNKSSILGKWSKGAQVDDDAGVEDSAVQVS